PGVMMGMVRCNVPAVFVYGGSALPGRFAGRDVTILDSYEAIGAVMTGDMDEASLALLERACLPSVGACAGQFTANTMAMVHEAGIAFDVDDVAKVFERTPLIADLRPGGRFTAKDVHEIGGTAVILRALLDGGHLDGGCLTVTGETIAQTYGDAALPDGAVVR